MRSLEAKVPPPAVAVATATAMWFASRFLPLLAIPYAVRLGLTATLLLLCIGFSLAGVLTFRRAGTTVNPTKPETTSFLVCSGIYRVTRNPMYVGLTFGLVAFAVFCSSPWLLFGPVAFALYINRFQIRPEERALEQLFGSEYAAYRARVRRWL